MYEKHFGLTSKPFGSKAEGTGVFSGPRQAKIITSLQKGIAAPDAVVTVTGPAGVGKSTLVNKALETLPTGRTAAQIGRMPLSAQEVVDLLMAGFGIKKNHQGGIRRYAAFRRLLQQQRENDIPVAIVIEDAQRVGTDALAEVEALTAADTSDAASANIILMGQPGLHDLLSTPDLGRLKQRIRLRQPIDGLTEAEVQGYLKHCIRAAGGNYDDIFEPGAESIVYGCSEGIPRMINTLCESALTTAMEENLNRVPVDLLRRIALDAFGYEHDATSAAPVLSANEADADTATNDAEIDAGNVVEDDIDWEAPAPAEAATEDAAASPAAAEIGHDIVVESGSYPARDDNDAAAAPTTPEPSKDVRQDKAIEHDDGIPELINDTQPELRELAVPVIDEFADLPVLKPERSASGQATEPQAINHAEDQQDIESTQTIAQPADLTIDEAVSDPMPGVDEKVDSAGQADDTDQDHLDLDAALSPEVDETNVMRGITRNFDAVAENEMRGDTDGVKSSTATTDVHPALESGSQPEPAPVPEIMPVLVKDEETVPDPEPELSLEEAAFEVDLPMLTDSMRLEVEKAAVPDDASAPGADPSETTTGAPAMRDPATITPGENRESDIDALEEALAAAKKGQLASPGAANGAVDEPRDGSESAVVPEITLDKVIADQQTQNVELDRFRDEIGNASSLEDISDVMAETLFGCEEFDRIAAEVVAAPAGNAESPDKGSVPSPVKLADEDMPNAANDGAEAKPVTPVQKPAVSSLPRTTAPASMQDGDVPLNESLALRIDILNKMKSNAAAAAENVELGTDDKSDVGATKGPQPEPIESQINTSITQTLKALKLSKAPATEVEIEDKPEKKSGGLFSRFKKSS